MERKKLTNDTDQRPFSMIYHDFFKSNLLNTYEKMIFIALKVFSDNQNQCFPSLNTLSVITGISKRKIQNTLKEMEQKHIISIENRLGTKGGMSSNLYTLHDYKEIWNTKNTEDFKSIDNTIIEKHMIEVLTSKGYCVTKEKEPGTTAPSKETVEPSTNNNHNSDINHTVQMKKSQDIERYTINQIHQLFGYDIMLQEHPEQQKDIDSVMNVLHNVMNTSKPIIRIAGQDKPAMAVIRKFMKLDSESIMYAIKKFSEQTDRIKNPIAYLTTILYTAQEQRHLDLKNQISNEAAKAEPIKEKKKTYGRNQYLSNGFTNFQQREYDYEKLEKMLLNQPNPEKIDLDPSDHDYIDLQLKTIYNEN